MQLNIIVEFKAVADGRFQYLAKCAEYPKNWGSGSSEDEALCNLFQDLMFHHDLQHARRGE